MSKRVTGYHYITMKDGTRKRVYNERIVGGNGRYKMKPSVPRVLKGSGGYYDSAFVKKMRKIIPKGSFEEGGRVLGGPLGSLAGKALAKIAGFGAYTIKSNSLIDEGQSPARMHTGSANTRVTHREYICDIVSSSSANTFSLQAFSLNPGLFQTFPWISAIAQQYQEWVPLGMVFEFKTLSADAIASSTNNTLGGIIMATNYNAAAPNFSNKQAMDNTEYTTSYKPSESFYHAIECAPHQNVLPELYIRSGAVPSGQDQKTYDLGNFQIASFGIQGTSVVLGELWLSYDIELRKPISTAAQGLDVLSDHFQLGSVINTAPFGTTSTLQAGSSIGGTITSSGTTYNFNKYLQEGNYLINYIVTGTAAAITAPLFTANNGNLLAIWSGDSLGGVSVPINGVSTSKYSALMVFQITGQNATLVVGTAGTLPSSVTSGDLFVTQINSAIDT